VIHNVRLDPLPYPDSERLGNAVVEDMVTSRSRDALPVAEFLDYREHSTSFEDVVRTRGESMLLTTSGGAEPMRAVWVTPNFFSFMGLKPLLGTHLTPEDGQPRGRHSYRRGEPCASTP
jgi:hypothetical protein